MPVRLSLLIAFLALFSPARSRGQEPPAAAKPALVNDGSPIRVPYQCSDEDIAASGLHCTPEEPCSALLELASVEAVGARLFLAGNLHTEAVTLQSILLASSDTGKTWTEPFERIRGASLDRIQFFDYETGWISGQIVQPLPRDPFFLLTKDGGATWRRRPVFSESRPGAVDRFGFDSRTNGVLWIDRTQSGESGALYEHYETTTGGESWTLREALNRPPAGSPGDRSRDTGWRLRPDRPTQSYSLERRVEGKWQRVAAFLIAAGECRPSLTPLPEPPEPAPAPPVKPPGPPRKKR